MDRQVPFFSIVDTGPYYFPLKGLWGPVTGAPSCSIPRRPTDEQKWNIPSIVGRMWTKGTFRQLWKLLAAAQPSLPEGARKDQNSLVQFPRASLYSDERGVGLHSYQDEFTTTVSSESYVCTSGCRQTSTIGMMDVKQVHDRPDSSRVLKSDTYAAY
jgi:hypothetical protein